MNIMELCHPARIYEAASASIMHMSHTSCVLLVQWSMGSAGFPIYDGTAEVAMVKDVILVGNAEQRRFDAVHTPSKRAAA